MANFAIGCLLTLAGLPVEVKPLTGPPVTGQLLELTATAATLETSQGRQQLDLANLWEITPTQPATPLREPTGVWVELVDGSRLCAAQFTVTQGIATIFWTNGEQCSLPTRAVVTVRWRDHGQTPDLARQWAEIVSQKVDSDLVVVRRNENLDQLEGVLLDVTPELVHFELNGRRLDASRKKLDGIVYYHPAGDDFRQRLGQVTDVHGSLWNSQACRLAEGRMELVTVAGVKSSLPAEQVLKISLAGNHAVWLSDLEPETSQWRPYEGPYADSALWPLLTRWFQPRKDRSYSGEALRLGGTEYRRGLALRTQTELVYRLPEKFRQLQVIAGIDDREGGSVQLTIAGDERVLLSEPITAGDPPRTIELDLTGVKRLKILVSAGQRMRIGDQLVLGEARLIK